MTTLVARFFDILPSSLSNYVNGRTLTRTRRKGEVLINVEKAGLVDYMMKMETLGYSLSMADVKIKVAEMVQKSLNFS
jgi:hypothetical protein